jgi:glucose-6-phosphate 1-dehydrogenase
LAAGLTYLQGDYNQDSTFSALTERLSNANHPIFHLAIPPSLFGRVAEQLANAGLDRGSRLVIEKPFGRDLSSAQALNNTLHQHFDEQAIFRIDHFLGKETLRSLLVSRFSNVLMEPLWNRQYVSAVKITMAEEFGVADRGAFYDSVGALKDVVQNHLLQMVALIAMDQPVDETATGLRDEKVKVLRAIRSLTRDNYVRGQYDGYLDVDGVTTGSTTETFAALRLEIDSPRWAGVPFLIRTGKSLAETMTEWTLEFHRPAKPLFVHHDDLPHNKLRFQVKPTGVPRFTMLAKVPGEEMEVAEAALEPIDLPQGVETEPYELLLEEAMKGDPTLFARQDSVEESWRILQPVLDDAGPVHTYAQQSWGPAEAEGLATGVDGWPTEPAST